MKHLEYLGMGEPGGTPVSVHGCRHPYNFWMVITPYQLFFAQMKREKKCS